MLSYPPSTETTNDSYGICHVTVMMSRTSPRDLREKQLEDADLWQIIECFQSQNADTSDYSGWTDRGHVMTQGVLHRYSPDSESEKTRLCIELNKYSSIKDTSEACKKLLLKVKQMFVE
ncbi:hypothetical protein RN001_003298 [Aquatica leii]|uniref:Uncharacterized protein n=1 Tax=Aquatica leii TaxID=1421715 RepID=A0AAN7SKN9_9COLE|nr:hypothetical protein RN001_003298 [Aquatica leii]